MNSWWFSGAKQSFISLRWLLKTASVRHTGWRCLVSWDGCWPPRPPAHRLPCRHCSWGLNPTPCLHGMTICIFMTYSSSYVCVIKRKMVSFGLARSQVAGGTVWVFAARLGFHWTCLCLGDISDSEDGHLWRIHWKPGSQEVEKVGFDPGSALPSFMASGLWVQCYKSPLLHIKLSWKSDPHSLFTSSPRFKPHPSIPWLLCFRKLLSPLWPDHWDTNLEGTFNFNFNF